MGRAGHSDGPGFVRNGDGTRGCDVEGRVGWLTSRPHLPRLSRRGRRWWRSRRTGYRRCGGSRCIPVVANRVLGVEGQRNGRGRALEGGLGRDARSFSRPAASGTRVAREGRPSAVRGGRRVSVGARGMRTHVRRLGLDGLQVGLQPQHGGRLLARRARHGPLGSNFRVGRGDVGFLLARLGLSARV